VTPDTTAARRRAGNDYPWRLEGAVDIAEGDQVAGSREIQLAIVVQVRQYHVASRIGGRRVGVVALTIA